MGYFETVVEANFRKDENGRETISPIGFLGKSYVLEEKQQVSLRKYIKLFFILLLASMFTLNMMGLFLVTIGVIFVLTLLYYIMIYWIVRNCEKVKTQTKLNINHRIETVATKMGYPFIIFGFIFCVLMSVVYIRFIFLEISFLLTILCLIMIVFSLYLIWFYGKAISIKRKQKSNHY